MITIRKRRQPRYAGLGLRGFGDVVHGVQEENCAVLPFALQYDCSQRNMAAVDASYADNPLPYLGGGVYVQPYVAPAPVQLPAPVYQPAIQPAPAPAPVSHPATQSAPVTVTPGSTPAAAQAQAQAAPVIGGFSFASIPWWGWLAGGAGAIFLFGGRHGR